jgi:hypothetical protein
VVATEINDEDKKTGKKKKKLHKSNIRREGGGKVPKGTHCRKKKPERSKRFSSSTVAPAQITF